MKALTISQPYASLIASGEKWVENRRWPTKYRGPLAIHAGKGTQYLTAKELRESGMPFGALIAVAYLVDCVTIEHIRAGYLLEGKRTVGEAAAHVHTEGPWCWILENVEPIVAHPCRGSQGLWDTAGEQPEFFSHRELP